MLKKVQDGSKQHNEHIKTEIDKIKESLLADLLEIKNTLTNCSDKMNKILNDTGLENFKNLSASLKNELPKLVRQVSVPENARESKIVFEEVIKEIKNSIRLAGSLPDHYFTAVLVEKAEKISSRFEELKAQYLESKNHEAFNKAFQKMMQDFAELKDLYNQKMSLLVYYSDARSKKLLTEVSNKFNNEHFSKFDAMAFQDNDKDPTSRLDRLTREISIITENTRTIAMRLREFVPIEEILRLFYSTEFIVLDKFDDTEFKAVIGRRSATDIYSPELEPICSAGELIGIKHCNELRKFEIKKIEVLNTAEWKDNDCILNSVELDEKKILTCGEAASYLYANIRSNEAVNEEMAKKEIFNLFFSPTVYNLGKVGRYKINKKFNYDEADGVLTLTLRDILSTVKYLIRVKIDEEPADDIDHLGNRRIRSVGEQLTNALKVGFARMERLVKERISITDHETLTPQNLISIKPITAVIKEFFGTSQLSQFMDQTNPLSAITHKRRLNALGPGGLTRERAGFEVRDIHYTHYGRMCPIETPEGPNIGLIVSLTTYSRINEYGFIETPYRRVLNGKVTGKIDYLSAIEEDRFHVTPANTPVNKDGTFCDKLIPTRFRGSYPLKNPAEVDYMDVSPKQLISISSALIPFLEHDDANRALMGSNMQRQGVPLMIPEAPIVGTGMEWKAAVDSGFVQRALRDGSVETADNSSITIIPSDKPRSRDIYTLKKNHRTNQDTCFNQKPTVIVGQKVKAGDVLSSGPAIDNGELAMGKNVLTAFMTWEGYNYEDAILVSDRLVKDDVFTSIHIEEFEIEARETKLGREYFTRDIPNISEEDYKELDNEGIIQIGTRVKAGSILAGKVTPKGNIEVTPEYKLLHSIFGEKAKEVKDTSLRMPNGDYGIVVDVKRYSRESGDDLKPGVEEKIKVLIAKKRKIQEGDKFAGRHGNKGVIARVLPVEDMPFLPDGTPIDLILNPLGVPSRMNIGQIFELLLGQIGYSFGVKFATPVFDGAKDHDIKSLLKAAGLNENGKSILYDGRSGEQFLNEITVGQMYILKLAHLADDKIHARSTGPYSLVTQQPLGGKAQFGGQRVGEMEVWTIEAYGASNVLQEFLTVKSDSMEGRRKIYEAIVKGEYASAPGIPESFNVLVQELRGLGMNIEIFDKEDKPINITARKSKKSASSNI
ncbi:MAG: DNA-directed RNA polymerase subunit beta [Spirochaetes bacterium GWF1_41_5]|nr:MAG: DNA-directed RNA polymerase subunit beta [Spirochaetes bacterium GWF1_41_5]